MINSYEDIIDLPRHISKNHQQMARENRAAQFAPFAALTGYGEAINESGRLTDRRIELDENEKAILDLKLRQAVERIPQRYKVEVTFFKADKKKDGGSYITVKGILKKIDESNRQIVLQDGTKIPINDVLDILTI